MVGAKVCYGRLDVELVPAWRADVDECLKSIAPVSRIYSDADLAVVSHHGPLRALASQLAGEATAADAAMDPCRLRASSTIQTGS